MRYKIFYYCFFMILLHQQDLIFRIHMLKYFRIWFWFRGDIRLCKKSAVTLTLLSQVWWCHWHCRVKLSNIIGTAEIFCVFFKKIFHRDYFMIQTPLVHKSCRAKSLFMLKFWRHSLAFFIRAKLTPPCLWHTVDSSSARSLIRKIVIWHLREWHKLSGMTGMESH